MTRASQFALGRNIACPFRNLPSRESSLLSVTPFSVKPSRCCRPPAKLIAVVSLSGPDTLPRTSHKPLLPTGAVTAPVHLDIDGFADVTLTMPPSVLRP